MMSQYTTAFPFTVIVRSQIVTEEIGNHNAASIVSPGKTSNTLPDSITMTSPEEVTVLIVSSQHPTRFAHTRASAGPRAPGGDLGKVP